MCYTWHLRSRSPGLVYNRVKVPVPKVLPMATHVAVFPEPPFSHAYCGPQNQAASPGLKPRYMYGWEGGRKGWGSVRSITWAGKSRNVKKTFLPSGPGYVLLKHATHIILILPATVPRKTISSLAKILLPCGSK